MKKETLHPRQKALLAYIKRNPSATYKELGHATGITSKAVTSYHIKELILKGYLHKGIKWISV